MTEFIVRDFLARHGCTLLDQGYTVVPIQQGKKAPGYDGWQKTKPSKDQVQEWLRDGFKNAGVGILTKHTCAIDIDCLDDETALKFEEWCKREIGKAPVRIGRAPKRLLLYRTDEPFSKRRSAEYFDQFGQKQLLEVLGNGQQFVAFHVHPDTGKHYEWVDDVSPLNVRAADLTTIKPEQIDRLLQAFEEHAKAEEWEIRRSARSGLKRDGQVDADNPWIEDTHSIEITTEELRSRLLLVKGCEDYDTWFMVGMALYHQFDGDDEGFELWNEWSEAADNYDPDSLERKWPTFEIEGKKRAPLTARYILRLSRESVFATALELSVALRDAFINAKTIEDWETARKKAREAEIDGLSRSTLAVIAKDRRDAITGVKTSLAEIKKAIAYSPSKSESTPKWAEDWVYDVEEDRFFDTARKISASKQGFDAMYDRFALTRKDIIDGNSNPSHTASDLALNLHKIPVVTGRRYMPGRDPIFSEPNGTFANSYPEHEIPKIPDSEELKMPRHIKNVERVKAHLAHLLPNPKEQRMLLDWMSWVVQNPGNFVRYAVLLQGVQGDGKTFLAEMMRAVMGVSNVRMANANTIIKSDFSDWAIGQCVCCVEEIRLHGTRGIDKWEAINKVKPFITNVIIEVHPKGKAPRNYTNTTSYMLFSNYKDAIPLEEGERRYLVLFSQWQDRDQLKKFREEHPTYFMRLYGALYESAGALRAWLLGHTQHEDFKPMDVAPDTPSRKIMVRKSKPEFVQIIDEIIAEDETLEASRMLLDVTGLSDSVVARGAEWPSPKSLSSMLERDGYESLGKIRIGEDVHTFYTKSPDAFMSNGSNGHYVDPAKVKNYMKARWSVLNVLDNDL